MSKEYTRTHETHGMEDHFHVAPAAKPFHFDPRKRADPKVVQTAHDVLTGKIEPDAQPEDDDDDVVIVPEEYVQAVATLALRWLHRKGCRSGFSVKVDPDQPHVILAYDLSPTMAATSGQRAGWEQRTNCLPAFVDGKPVEWVAESAVATFLDMLQAARSQRR